MNCYEHEECEYNAQPLCCMPPRRSCPHGIERGKTPTNADLVHAMSDEDRLKWLHNNFGGRSFTLKELMDRLAKPAQEDGT